jgi:hypothetical protein
MRLLLFPIAKVPYFDWEANFNVDGLHIRPAIIIGIRNKKIGL